MKFKPQHITLFASLVVLLVSGAFAADFYFRAAMAYYDNEPIRTSEMHRFQSYANVCSAVFVNAVAVAIVFGVILPYKRRGDANKQNKLL